MDWSSFIKVFCLEEQMSVQIYVDELWKKFENKKSYYNGKVMIHHIPYNLKKVGDIPKKVKDVLPPRKFKSYFQKIVYKLHKVLRCDVIDVVYGSLYIMAYDI